MKKFSITTIVLGALAILAAAVAGAQGPGADTGIQQAVARVSFLSGDVSYNRGDEPDVWQDAAVNVPMTLGDRMYLRDGRAELQLQGGNFVRLGAQSRSFGAEPDRRGRAVLAAGRHGFVPHLRPAKPGILRGGHSQRRGHLRAGRRLPSRRGPGWQYPGGRPPGTGARRGGRRAGSVARRQRDGCHGCRFASVRHRRSSGARRLGSLGGSTRSALARPLFRLCQCGRRWRGRSRPVRTVEQHSSIWPVWSPVSVEAGWQPYRSGRWGWQDPWGWTWIADEPWGWAPYHYGRWIMSSSRWYWVPVSPRAAYARYSPALVAFVGGGSGWSASFSIGGGGYVGWFPLGPRDPFVPWWGSRTRAYGNVTNVTYVNRNYVTVVNQNTFVSGGGIARNYVRDSSVVRQIVAAPVIRGALPVMPAAGALRVSGITARAARPPAPVNSRAVVTRLAPPPAPPTFQSKVAAIREQRGAPVTAAAAAQLSIQTHQGARALHPVRPVAAPSGAVTLRSRKRRRDCTAGGDRAARKGPRDPRPADRFHSRGCGKARDQGSGADRSERRRLSRPSDPATASRREARARPLLSARSRSTIRPRSARSRKRLRPDPGKRSSGGSENRQQQPIAPRGQSAPPPVREKQINNPPPKARSSKRLRPEPGKAFLRRLPRESSAATTLPRIVREAPPRVRERNPPATPENRQLQPRNNPPPQRSFRGASAADAKQQPPGGPGTPTAAGAKSGEPPGPAGESVRASPAAPGSHAGQGKAAKETGHEKEKGRVVDDVGSSAEDPIGSYLLAFARARPRAALGRFRCETDETVPSSIRSRGVDLTS